MNAQKIKKIIIISAVALAVVDMSLLFAASRNRVDPALLAEVAPLQTTSINNTLADNASQASSGIASSQSLTVADSGQEDADEANATPPPQNKILSLQQAGLAPISNADPSSDQQKAFKDSIEQSLPLAPSQIIAMHQIVNASEQAAETSPVPPQTPLATSLAVSLAPGVTPPVLRLQKNFLTSVVMTDSQGQPWPIASIDVAEPNAVDVSWDKKGSTFIVKDSKDYGESNLAVTLVGSQTPVMLTLLSGDPKALDSRVDLHVDASQGPVINSGEPEPASPVLLSVLDSVGPGPAGISVPVKGCPDCLAWSIPGGKDEDGNQKPGKFFLRAPANTTLLSPGYVSMSRSADGTSAYLINEQSPTLSLLMSKNGVEDSYSVTGLQ